MLSLTSIISTLFVAKDSSMQVAESHCIFKFAIEIGLGLGVGLGHDAVEE